MRRFLPVSIMLFSTLTGAAFSAEFPAGDPLTIDGLEIRAVYLQAVKMDLEEESAEIGDIHLEADIQATANNPHGFEDGNWVPYLTVAYELSKKGSSWKAAGTFVPMVANDGPHYGANVTLDGPGAYELKYVIQPPSKAGFMRHVDRETSVPEWWKPIVYTGRFKFVGTGKKGGY